MAIPRKCSTCQHAGYDQKGSDLSATLSDRQYKALERAENSGTADYYCVYYDEPVDSSRGAECSEWKADC